MEDQEALETSALVGKLAEPVEYEVDYLFANGVMSTSVVVGGIFLARDQLFWMEQLTVGTSANLI